ncbi:TIR domain-containing adapter molecule 1 [Hoplias malabaricus]|uniref:TIR domain-containing adapter molecule 1 n=1 Tax=Hoplias malabaricus TaxID=27720 RepID=UPI003462B134
MGSSNQPFSRNPIMFEDDTDTAVKMSSGNTSDRLFSGLGGPRLAAGHQNMVSSKQPFSRNASILSAEASPVNLDDSYPSSLRSSSTCTSYSLEISLSTADAEKESKPLSVQKISESRNDQNQVINPSVHPGIMKLADSSDRPPSLNPLQRHDQSVNLSAAKFGYCSNLPGNCQIISSKNGESAVEKDFSSITHSTGNPGVQAVCKLAYQSSKAASVQNMEQMEHFNEQKKRTENEEGAFYGFVILHAPEDIEEASRIKTRLEGISSTPGATFAEDFAEPGQSSFRCVEDAINNSAYIMLLLTPNFNTRLNEMNTDSALMNSIEKPHKYNTVIPLLPRDNSLTATELHMALRTKIPMKEKDKTFEIMARKVLDPEKIQNQKKIWKQEQLIRKQQEMQQQLQEENIRHRDLIRESTKVSELQQQRTQLLMQQQRFPQSHAPQLQSYQTFSGGTAPFGPVPPQWQNPLTPQYCGTRWHQPPSNIHIQNAKYIMIGNDTSMTVGSGENNSGDEDCL